MKVIGLLGGVTVGSQTLDQMVMGLINFDSQPGHYQVTTLGKLCTAMCLCHQWYKLVPAKAGK